MLTALLIIAAAAPSIANVRFSFHPCENVTFKHSLPVGIGVVGFAQDGHWVSIHAQYAAQWANRANPAKFDLALPTGAYEYSLSVDLGGKGVCYTQSYVAALAGHTRHEYAPMIEGLPDPFTAAAVAGEYAWAGTAVLGFIAGDAACGDPPRDFRALPSPQFLNIEDGAYYAVLLGPWNGATSIPVLQLQRDQRKYYVRLPLARPQPSPGEINGVATFVRYDIDEKRVTKVLASAPDRLLCQI